MSYLVAITRISVPAVRVTLIFDILTPLSPNEITGLRFDIVAKETFADPVVITALSVEVFGKKMRFFTMASPVVTVTAPVSPVTDHPYSVVVLVAAAAKSGVLIKSNSARTAKNFFIISPFIIQGSMIV
jgi:hypothetical protein